jgi:hypothetical protein
VVTALSLGSESPAPIPVVWISRWWASAWPIVPTLMAVLALDRRASVRLTLVYVAAGSGVVMLVTFGSQLARGTFSAALLTNVYWFILGLALEASIPLALLLVTGIRRIRSVLPVALATTLAFGFGSVLFRNALVAGLNFSPVRSAVFGLAGRTSQATSYYGLFFVASLPVGWIAWRGLRWLAASYERKQFSDVQLLVDCWWLIVAADQGATTLAIGQGGRGLLTVGAALIAYRMTVALALRRLPIGDPRLPPRLLLLRVFGYQGRTESLFDHVAQRWRFRGPVQLVAGLDLATRSVDPGDMLAFVNGRLDDQYIAAAGDLPGRVAAIDVARDPDGRYRVSELYCHADTWQPAVQALLDVSDTVLMDLRGFSTRSLGCRFELEQLVRRVPADRIVLICDRTTDLRLLGETLSAAWTSARAEGCTRGPAQISIVHIEDHSRREFRVLFDRLLGLAAPQRVLGPAELPSAL